MQGRNKDADIENRLVDRAGEEVGTNLESSIDIYTPLCVKYIVTGKLLSNTGAPASALW